MASQPTKCLKHGGSGVASSDRQKERRDLVPTDGAGWAEEWNRFYESLLLIRGGASMALAIRAGVLTTLP